MGDLNINRGKQFDDLGDALDYICKKGFTNEFHLNDGIIAHSSKKEIYERDQLYFCGFIQYDDNSGNEKMNIIYAIETKSGVKGYIVSENQGEQSEKVDNFVKKMKVSPSNQVFPVHDVNG